MDRAFWVKGALKMPELVEIKEGYAWCLSRIEHIH
jgi:hypothetical protein